MSGLRILAVAIATATALVPVARAGDPAVDRLECSAPVDLTRLSEPLSHLADRLARHEAVTILALGSSSTAGVGASTIDKTYPRRLSAILRARLPGVPIQVLNRGVSGEDALEMLKRLDREVLAEKPDLVLWQVGTNAILRYDGVTGEAPLLREGLRRIRATGADVLLIDPQYAPKVLRDPDAEPMVALMSLIANDMGVPVFRRFALMRYWHEKQGMPFNSFLSPDLFHMNDWSYVCFSENLANAIIAGTSQPNALQEKERETARAISRVNEAAGDLIPERKNEQLDAALQPRSNVLSDIRGETSVKSQLTR